MSRARRARAAQRLLKLEHVAEASNGRARLPGPRRAATGAVAILCLVVGAGCRVAPPGSTSTVDAEFLGGDGLPARVIVDAWLWGTPAAIDAVPADAQTAAGGDVRPDAGAASEAGTASSADASLADGGATCSLLDGSGCPIDQACFPDEALSGGTACHPATPGFGIGSRFPCQLQDDCSAGEACVDLKGSGKLCLELCRSDAGGATAAGTCADLGGTTCVPLTSYPGVGYCS